MSDFFFLHLENKRCPRSLYHFFIRFLHSIEHVPLKTAIWKITGSISQILLKGNEVMNVRNAVGKTKYEIIQKIHLKQKVVFRETSFDEIWFSLISLIL